MGDNRLKQIHTLELKGCTPETLMGYLKALGIFRLVAQQRDSQTRAWWQNDTFFLQSNVDQQGLLDFFLETFQPTPIVSPWNGGSGFYAKDNTKAMSVILNLDSARFQKWHEVVAICKEIMAEAQSRDNISKKDWKEWILAQCRGNFPDEALDWLDATYVLTQSGAKFAPLLGTGGNDGRMEFSNNFMQNVVSALDLDGLRPDEGVSRGRLMASLFKDGSPRLNRGRSSGFFNPGGVGGANSTEGFSGEALTNPWDFVLMFEGVLLFAGSAARRLGTHAAPKAIFPFTVDSSATGYGTSSDIEYGDASRAEFWAPLWERPVILGELAYLVAEGRAQLGQRQVASGAEFARAVVGLGTERGIHQFQRFGFMVRNGLAYLASPLGRFHVGGNTKALQRANVLLDLDHWLQNLRRNAQGRNTVLNQVEGAIIEFCRKGRASDLQEVLTKLGQAEKWLSKSGIIEPIRHLSHHWRVHANDESSEFRLALSMASILPVSVEEQLKVGSIRENLEPVEISPQGRATWREGSTSCVWNAGNPFLNMLTVLERRCLQGSMQSCVYPPLVAKCPASLKDIAQFLNGNVNVKRIADLALPLSWSFAPSSRTPKENTFQQQTPYELPTAYAVMKLTLLPEEFVCKRFGEDRHIRMEPAMFALLRVGRIRQAFQMACRRLIASGLQPSSIEPGIADRSDQGLRLAAALLFPLDKSAHCALAERALRKPANSLKTEPPENS